MPLIEVSARIGAMIVQSAAAAGVDRAVLERATGFALEQARDPDARIPLALETRLWDEAARLAEDPAFGIHTAERVRPGAFDVLDYAVRTAPTPREALARLARYNRLAHDAAVFAISDDERTTRIEHRLGHGGQQSRHAAEFTLASIVVIGGQIAGAPVLPLRVELSPAAPDAIAEHVRVFGVRPWFGASANAIEWERALLERPNPTADPVLGETIVRHAEALLATRPALAASQADRVRQVLASRLGAGVTTLAQVARQLKMSERSLQRRLAGEATSFEVLLDEIRHQLALRYLADPRVAISEVAYLLGYSEPSPFHRAFRRWTGSTPGERRARAS